MELARAYDPGAVEQRRYEKWQSEGLFGAVPGEGKPYCITIPPPNVTGSLHIGHALNNSIMDCLIRWRRMCGDNALCLPGTDHAGIATQAVVERELAVEGLTRHDLGRERFVERCWQWREQYGNRIYLQLQRLGCSYDWSRARFTLDEPYVEAIYEEFLRWWDRGLIYRGARVVNWCPRCSSAISDIEVNSEERQGSLYHIRYPMADGDDSVVVATTRPETMLGDSAVAVNPADERYAPLRGRMVRLPLTDRVIPVIFDEYAKMDFGTGAVKVTPAHDLDDFEAGLRHHLPQIKVIGDDGRMTADAGEAYAGLDRWECRERILADLGAQGLLVGAEPYVVKTPLCDRCKTVLEPLLSEQWFARQSELAAPAIEAVESGRIRFLPERYVRVYLDWLRNIRDWCISRQLWWGHRMPVWWAEDGRHSAGRDIEDAARRLGVAPSELRQDEDVLDTWFSSALWPHATLGWPRATDDLAFWYPTDLLSTAQEIIYLWVARMVMTGLDFMDEIPFRDVYIHATVLDARGERMSKSKGNGVDPLEMIEKYGADALRMSLLLQAGKNQDIRYSEDKVRLAGTFVNKLWNAARFVIGNLQGYEDAGGISAVVDGGLLEVKGGPKSLDLTDRWILSRLQTTVGSVAGALETYDLDDAARSLYAFVWDDFCDWFVEASKVRLRAGGECASTARLVLAHVLDQVLRLLHPLVPHVTEELWQALRGVCGLEPERESLMTARFPLAHARWASEVAEKRMELLMAVIRGIRNLRAEFGVPPATRVDAWLVPESREVGLTVTDNLDTLASLARLGGCRVSDGAPADTRGWSSFAVAGAQVYVSIGSALDVTKELARIERGLSEADAEIARSEAKLANRAFVERAPEGIVAKERALLADHQESRARLLQRRTQMRALTTEQTDE